MFFLQHRFSFGAEIIKTLFFCFHIFFYIQKWHQTSFKRGQISEIPFPDPTSNQRPTPRSELPAPFFRQIRSMNPLASALRVETRLVRMLLDFPHLSRNPWNIQSMGTSPVSFPEHEIPIKNQRKNVWYILP